MSSDLVLPDYIKYSERWDCFLCDQALWASEDLRVHLAIHHPEPGRELVVTYNKFCSRWRFRRFDTKEEALSFFRELNATKRKITPWEESEHCVWRHPGWYWIPDRDSGESFFRVVEAKEVLSSDAEDVQRLERAVHEAQTQLNKHRELLQKAGVLPTSTTP